MKIIKAVFYIFTFGFLSLLALISPQFSYSQTPQKLLFAVTPYQTRDDIDFFIAHSTHPLDYFEGGDVPSPIFLSIITSQQQNEYISAGYKPNIIDSEAGEITDYYIITIDDPANKDLLKVFDLVYPISNTSVLIKVHKGKKFRDYHEAGIVELEAKRYTRDLAPPPFRIKATIIPSPTKEVMRSFPTTVPVSKTEPNSVNILPIILIILAAAISYSIWKKRKNKKIRLKNENEK